MIQELQKESIRLRKKKVSPLVLDSLFEDLCTTSVDNESLTDFNDDLVTNLNISLTSIDDQPVNNTSELLSSNLLEPNLSSTTTTTTDD